ncbi:MAG: inositol 2-dehydrogenase [Pseudomonadota bacterium]
MIGIALLGAGRMGQVHADAIAQADARIVCVFDQVTEVAQRLGDATGAKVIGTAEDAINHPDVDAVMVVTSSDTHTKLILKAHQAGKAVFCEKPLSNSLEDAQNCIDALGDDGSKRVFLGFNRRFDKHHGALCARVKSGEIGTLEQLIITSRDPYPPPLEYIPKSGGLFSDMMIHDFDMARSILTEEPVSIVANGSSVVDPEIGTLGDVDSATVIMRTASGVLVIIVNSRRCAFGYDQRIEAFGSQGMLISNNVPKTSVTLANGDSHDGKDALPEFFMDRYAESYVAEIETFLDCVRSGKDMPVNAIDGLRAMMLANAATQSNLTGEVVEIAMNELMIKARLLS